jgi:hypothetical protein
MTEQALIRQPIVLMPAIRAPNGALCKASAAL